MDQAAVELQPVSPDQNDFASFFRLPAQYQLLTEFQMLDIEAQPMLHGISEKDRNLGAYLKILNRKLDALCRTVALMNDPIDEQRIQSVSLSEGGLALAWDEHYPPGTLLLIKLILLPSYLGLLLKGRVLHPSPDHHAGEVHMEFIDLDDHQRQLIARHIIRKQQEARRQRTEI